MKKLLEDQTGKVKRLVPYRKSEQIYELLKFLGAKFLTFSRKSCYTYLKKEEMLKLRGIWMEILHVKLNTCFLISKDQ